MKTFKSLVSKHFTVATALGEVLSRMTGMPRGTLEEAAMKGAVWVQKGKGKTLRERSLDKKFFPDDTVSLFYDDKVLRLPPVRNAECLFENERYGVWFKPAGVVPQGTQSGDHSSLLRHIEVIRKSEVFLVHRLDRETAGLMIFAYTSEAAGRLGDLFQKNQMKKEYEAVVLGELTPGSKGTIDVSLDDKKATTHYEVLAARGGQSLLQVSIETGRLHQIRRHLDHIGHPVMGDPKYGRGNKNKEGLKLMARSLSFSDPWDKKLVSWKSSLSLSL